jgi:hypothetical protein
MPRPSIHSPRKLPKVVAIRLAKLAKVPINEQDGFCDRISEIVLRLSERYRRAASQDLVRAARAAQTLQQTFFRLNKQDRNWVENILQSQMQFTAGKIQHLESTILNVAMVFSAAIGRPSPLPRHLERILLKRAQPRVKDQMLRELVFGLLSAADEARGKLARALDRLREYLPGLVSDPLHGTPIQRLKTEFFQLKR